MIRQIALVFLAAFYSTITMADVAETASLKDELSSSTASGHTSKPATPGGTAAAQPEAAVHPVAPESKPFEFAAGAANKAMMTSVQKYIDADKTGNRNDWRKFWMKTHPKMTAAQLALALVVMENKGDVLGMFDPRICEESDPYADLDARSRRQLGHHGWGIGERWDKNGRNSQSRFETLVSVYRGQGHGSDTQENEAESNPRWGSDLIAHAKDCVEIGWNNSPGHKKAMIEKHTRFCYSMSIDRDGTAYCIGLYENDKGPRGVALRVPKAKPDADSLVSMPKDRK